MKKLCILVICIAMLVLGACTTPATPETAAPAAPAENPAAPAAPAENPPAPAVENKNLQMATGGSSGTYYPFGVAIAKVLNDNIEGMNVTVETTGASAVNLSLIAEGSADLAVVQNDVMSYAYNGEQNFSEKKITEFSAIATLYSEVCQIVAVKSSGITSVDQLKGKRVSIGDVGSGVESNALQILAAYGLTTDDIQVEHLGFGDSANAIKDGRLDAAFVTAGAPTTAIMELNATNPVTIVPIDETHATQLAEKYPFYLKYNIPAGTYSGIDTDIPTIAVRATLICNPNLSEQMVYDITKAIFEKQADIEAGHAKGAEINTTDAVLAVPTPFHPGAIKYFKEIGAM